MVRITKNKTSGFSACSFCVIFGPADLNFLLLFSSSVSIKYFLVALYPFAVNNWFCACLADFIQCLCHLFKLMLNHIFIPDLPVYDLLDYLTPSCSPTVLLLFLTFSVCWDSFLFCAVFSSSHQFSYIFLSQVFCLRNSN